ncbi:urease [Diaporthe eres]|uniref:Spindle pole body-associated protein cut12 domain-containing protein n=1 Tax=Diaporthe vaccinii TaxID=105482 RepID=A0ABR4F724_9PEZI|nr:urease [Diaporthe eres]
MLGWALHKATGEAPQNAPTPGPDDTFVEQPDTPAPVFAARAFKRALFGTPAPQRDVQSRKETRAAAAKSERPKPSTVEDKRYESPTRPQGILLTPGTGASRRKRVSFGRDVKANTAAANAEAAKSRPRTKLQEALEKSRKENSRALGEDQARKPSFDPEEAEGDGAWEEVDELDREPDITVDLNEPRSQSGQYWKSEFQKYHGEARAEMEKLVKYKQLAKSYAKAKDAEALDLNERLREEQSKVVQMEQKITELAGQVTAKQGQGKDTRDDRKLMKDLTRQTALAVQYREQVEELETLLRESGYGAYGNRRRRGGTSPRTAQTLLETQRELRKAREQVQELNDLRHELKCVKTDLSTSEQRSLKLEGDKKKAVADLAKSEIKVAELERKLAKAEQDRQRKDSQYEKLKADYDALREKNKMQRASRIGDTQQPKQDLDLLSTGRNALSSWEDKFVDVQAKARDQHGARRRGTEDASFAVNNSRLDLKRASDYKSLGPRFQGLRSKGGDGIEDITHDLLQIRPRVEDMQTESPLTRSVSRSGKRKASGLATLDHHLFPEEEFTFDTPSRKISRTPSREFRVSKSPRPKSSRLSANQPALDGDPKSPALGLVRDRARSWKLDHVPDNPTTDAISSRPSSLPADRRAAAIARLEQKRAERRRGHESAALPGKENLRP